MTSAKDSSTTGPSSTTSTGSSTSGTTGSTTGSAGTSAKPDPAVDTELGVDHRRAGAVRRILNERANAVAYGNTDLVKRLDQDLKEVGFTGDPEKVELTDRVPTGRSSGKPNVTSPVVTSTTTTASSKPSTATSTTAKGSSAAS